MSAESATPATLADRIRRVQLVWSVVVMAFAGVGLVISRDLPFTDARGTFTGWPRYELYLVTFNRVSALVVLGLGVLGLVAALTGRRLVAWLASAGFAGVIVQTLVQWRDGATENLLASSGQTMSFALASCLLYGVTAWLAAQPEATADDPSRARTERPPAT